MERNALVLVADDDPLIRAAHRYLLEALGYGIVEAADGERALELATKHHFYAICIDVDMPKLSGIEATRKIRQHENGIRPTLIIGITSLQEAEHEKCLSAGMNLVLNKPVPIDILTETLGRPENIKMAC